MHKNLCISHKMNIKRNDRQMDKRRKTVLITGASSGIGYELAKVFAKNHYNLVLVARRQEKLEKLKEEIIECQPMKACSIDITLIEKDLSLKEAPRELFDTLYKKDIVIDILVNNAGIGVCGLFHEIDSTKDDEMIDINIWAVTSLTKLFALEMVKRKSGKILNVASTGSYQPGPLIAVYYATKAYVLSFSEALREELEPYGVCVTVLCPGATKTEFANLAGKGDPKLSMTAESVACLAYRGLMKGTRVIVPGFRNKIALFLTRSIPRNIAAKMVRKWQEKAMQQTERNNTK